MRPVHHEATSHNPPAPTEYKTHLRAHHHTRHYTRRFAGIFSQEALETISDDPGDVAYEEQSDSDALDRDTCATQAVSIAGVEQNSALSAAQHVITCDRAIHGSDHASECDPTKPREKELPKIPDDQRSMYTLATVSTDMQSTMDMMWRPKPKVHMCRSDRRALMQAQTQAVAMMHDADLKPTDKIQCRRRGCADILPGVDALKYHIHIHNIADSAPRCSDHSSSAVCKPSLPKCSTSHSNSPERIQLRSESSLWTHRKYLTTYPFPRRPSAGGLLPSFFSPRSSTFEVPQVPTLTTVANALTPVPSPDYLPAHNIETPSTQTSTPSRGRRKRKESIVVSVGAQCDPNIVMLPSPPSSLIMHRHFVQAELPKPVAVGSATYGSDNCISNPNESAHPVPERLMGPRSPVRALSPARAVSPIRDSIKRILSIGSPNNVTDE